jgi:hypothetical protein
MTAACVTALVLASCGSSDSSSNRNGRLNSTLCFDTQDEKDAAIADAQKALDEATPPTLEESSPSNNGGRATLAFIGPQLWWMHAASGASTTTTTQPATTTSSTSSTVASSSTSTSSTVASSSTSTSSTVASSSTSSTSTSSTVASSTDSTDVATDSTDVSTDSTDVSTETSVPLVGELLLQQLQDGLEAVTNAPLCDSKESSDTTLNPETSITCTATVRSDGASIDCARPLYVSFFYRTNAGGDENPVWLAGNEQTTFGPIEDVHDIQLAISSNGVYVFSQPVEPGIYDFEVPIEEETSETESESDEPYFSGTINPRVGVNELSFTVPEDYSASDLLLGLTFECESQELEASWYRQGVYVADFVNPPFDLGLPEGVCFLGLYPDDPEYVVAGETYDVVITAATDVQIEWEGPVELEGDGVSLGEGSYEESYYSGVFDPTTGEDTVSFTIPNNYSESHFWLELYAECEDQSIEAMIYGDGGYEPFIDPSEYFPASVFGEGMCGVWLIVDDAFIIPRGETFDVVIRTTKTTRIMWQGTVALDGDGVTRDGDTDSEGDQGLVWDEIFSGEIDADRYMTIEIPEGGRQVEVRGITTRFKNDQIYVDPYLEIIDVAGNVVAEDNDGGEDFGYGDYSSRLDVFLEEGTYILRGTTLDLWYGDEGLPSTYDLELRVGSVPVSTDQVAPSGDLAEEQQVQVEVLDIPPSNLEEPKPVFTLPVNEVTNRDKTSTEPNPVIPAGVTEVVCDSGCLLALREAAGVSEGVVTIQIGGEVIEVQAGARKAIIPVRPTAKEIQVTVTPSDGGEAVVLSTEVVVNSPRTFPTNFKEGAASVTKIKQRDSGIPTYLIVVLVALALAVAIGLVRRQKVRLPQ